MVKTQPWECESQDWFASSLLEDNSYIIDFTPPIVNTDFSNTLVHCCTEGQMGFFPESAQDPQCLRWATELRDGLKAKRSLPIPPKSMWPWVREMAGLRKEHGEDVNEVLTWFIGHIGGEYIPRVTSAKAFRAKFSQIKAAMERNGHEDEWNDELEEFKHIARLYADDMPFPIEIRSVLPTLIRVSAERWDKFRTHIRRGVPDVRGAFFIDKVLGAHSPTFIHDWFLLLSQKYGKMDHYNGPVFLLVFKANSSLFRDSFWHQWSNDWCNDPTAFDNLLLTLSAEVEKCK